MAKRINLACVIVIFALSIFFCVIGIIHNMAMIVVLGIVLFVIFVGMFHLWIGTYYPKNTKQHK